MHASKPTDRGSFLPTDIADVSHFVHPATPMDEEAASRGTTVYLVDKRIDMLPSLLGTNLCSLRPYVERLAFSAIWVGPRSPLVRALGVRALTAVSPLDCRRR